LLPTEDVVVMMVTTLVEVVASTTNAPTTTTLKIGHLCERKGHTILKCWKRCDHNYTGLGKTTIPSYAVDTK
jgi:hypothetical protein